MRVPWFNNWRASAREDNAVWTTGCAPHERTADEITLALRLIPLYHVRLQLDDATQEQRLSPLLAWQAPLLATIGAERTQRALRDIATQGVAILAVCPRELAEHYRDEFARLTLPCVIQPA